MKSFFYYLLFFVLSITTIACETTDIFDPIEEERIVTTMRINYFESLCNGAFTTNRCLNFQIGTAIGTDEWQTEAIQIEGFEFVHGYINEIEVEITPLDIGNCQDDCPTHAYKLIREISTIAVDDFCTVPPTPAMVCTKEYVPVCGCNEVTYSNECVAQASGVASWTLGECEG